MLPELKKSFEEEAEGEGMSLEANWSRCSSVLSSRRILLVSVSMEWSAEAPQSGGVGLESAATIAVICMGRDDGVTLLQTMLRQAAV